jgi:hypothetical protein
MAPKGSTGSLRGTPRVHKNIDVTIERPLALMVNSDRILYKLHFANVTNASLLGLAHVLAVRTGCLSVSSHAIFLSSFFRLVVPSSMTPLLIRSRLAP